MKTIYISIILFLGFCITTTAQEKSNHEIQGDTYSFNYSYEKAIESYTKANVLTIEGQRRLAESYHNLEKNVEAEATYSTLMMSTSGIIPEDYYNYATILKINKKYSDSNMWMDRFYKEKPTDLRAIDYYKNKNNLTNLLTDKGAFKITHLDINTDGVDYGTCYYKDKIVFSSSRGGSALFVKNDNWTGVPFTDIYISNVENGQLTKPTKIDNEFNGNLHDGPASFSNNDTYMAFTRNNYKDKTIDRVVEIQIYFSRLVNDKWTEPEPFFLNNKEYSVGQPCLTEDGMTLYFTSDMPGGFGGADIYRISKNGSDVWGKVENLGPTINTEGDEMFPFIEEKNKFLFFSSNGRFGLGGLDIYRSKINDYAFDAVQNVGYPLNTEFDDFAVIVDATSNIGYFSSNRAGGSGLDDIYTVSFLKEVEVGKKIVGIAKDEKRIAVPNTFVTLLNVDGSIQDTITTKTDAAYTFSVNSDKEYTVIGKKIGYTDGDTAINTFGEEMIINADIILTKELPKQAIARKIKVGEDLGKIAEVNLNNIYFDYGKFDIRPDAALELDKIIEVMNDNPNMEIEIGSHTDCRSSNEFNQKLSDKRAKATADYIKKSITKPSRIYGKGYGETKYIIQCNCNEEFRTSECSEEEHQQNRRSEFIIKKQ